MLSFARTARATLTRSAPSLRPSWAVSGGRPGGAAAAAAAAATTTTTTTTATTTVASRRAAYGTATSDSDSPLKGQHVISASQFDRERIEHVLSVAERMKRVVETEGHCRDLEGKVLLSCFMEPSTRTSSSFQTAMLRLGGRVVAISGETSSAKKGETLEDTVRVMQEYADAIVLRHPEEGAAARAAAVSRVPVLNAGDGQGEHPTQALLDLFCIRSEKGRLDGLTITVVGDLKFGRTVHSLGQLFGHYRVNLNLVSTPSLRVPAGLRSQLDAIANVTVRDYDMQDIGAALADADVLYLTRIQKERFASEEEYLREKGTYVIDTAFLDRNRAKADLLVMHPLPRVDEIAYSFDADPRAAYFKQVRYGMFTRMALLREVMMH